VWNKKNAIKTSYEEAWHIKGEMKCLKLV
jgi:hypothetical protein